MITAEEFLNLESKDNAPNFKLATVDPAYTEGLVKLRFDGEDIVSQKGYMFLSSYKPAANDRVLLVKVADTYIIMDKIVSAAPTGGVTTDSLTVTGTANVNILSVTGDTNVNTLTATGAVDFDSTLNVDGNSTLRGELAHRGTRLSFYNASPISKQTAFKPSASADITVIRTRLTELIDKLGNLGLVISSF